METPDEIKLVGELVLELLRTDTRARNDDKYLTFRVLQRILKQSDYRLSFSLTDLAKLPAFETIKRVRAKIQNVDKKFLPTTRDARIKRHIREEDFRAWAGAGQGQLF